LIESHGKPGRRCGLCGKTKKLTRTECCQQWICDDEDKYVVFSFARNSCSRNHRRFTLCGFHFSEEHQGSWQRCLKCRNSFETEMYVYYGTNEYNYERLLDIPSYEPTRCARCSEVISLSLDAYTVGKEGYLCVPCFEQMEAQRKR
jgi:hypothetical protein